MRKMIILLTVLLLTISGSVFAQVPAGFCGGLPEADCQIMTASTQAMAELESVSVDASLDLTIGNIKDAPFESLAFNLKAAGAYHVEPGLVQKYMGLQTDPAALFQDMSQFPQMMEDLFNGFDGQVNLALTLPDALVEMAASSEATIPKVLSTELRMLDGVGYVNLSAMAESLPKAGIPGGWYGLEIAKLVKSVMETALSQLDGAVMFGVDPDAMSAFADPAVLEGYVKIERLADSDGAAVFQMTMDMAALAESQAMRDLMQKQMEASGQTMSEADIEAALDMAAQMYKGMDILAGYSINLSDNTMRDFSMTINWDMAPLMSAAGEPATGAPLITLNLTAAYSDYNAAPAISAPANATVITAEQAMQMFMSEMTPQAAPGT